MMKRRQFLQTGLFSSLTTAISAQICANEESDSANTTSKVREEAREIPIGGYYDVIVCGGGPAGIGAALAAARSGAKTLLLESNGCLGGIWTAGILPWIINHGQPGIMTELKTKLKTMDAVCPIPASSFAFDPEKLKLLLENLCDEDSIDFLLHTKIVATVKSSDRIISHVVTESKSGRQAWNGTVMIDCTGDGDVAAQSGCGFDLGNEKGQLQPGSLLAVIDGIKFEELKEFIRSDQDYKSASKGRLLKLIRSLGIEPTYKSPAIYPIREDLFWVMMHHAYQVRFDDARSVTRHTVAGRKELHQIIDALRASGGAWKNIRLIGTAEQMGIREARRIHGLYKVTVDDILTGVKHKDAVCRVHFGFDVHQLDMMTNHGGTSRPKGKSMPYDIPSRALIAKDVDNLLMAGRCISGDFLAHSSYRVTGPATVLGEAAGKIAAEAATKKIRPKEVNFPFKYEET
jgi:hypothetical protein